MKWKCLRCQVIFDSAWVTLVDCPCDCKAKGFPSPSPWEPYNEEVKDSNLSKLQKEVHAWAAATFESQSVSSKLTHLQKELDELKENPHDRHEMADCLILLLGVAELQGIDLFEATREKFEIVKKRKWAAPDADGVCRHID